MKIELKIVLVVANHLPFNCGLLELFLVVSNHLPLLLVL